jgi:ferritin
MMPLNPEIAKLINEHLPKEGLAQWTYLRLALDCNTHGFFGCETYFKAQAADEAKHLQTLIGFINDFDAENSLPAIEPQPGPRFVALPEMFTAALEMEQTVTDSLSRICSAGIVAGDWLSVEFLQAFIAEQRNSEIEYRDILNRLAMAGDDLIQFDAWIGELVES